MPLSNDVNNALRRLVHNAYDPDRAVERAVIEVRFRDGVNDVPDNEQTASARFEAACQPSPPRTACIGAAMTPECRKDAAIERTNLVGNPGDGSAVHLTVYSDKLDHIRRVLVQDDEELERLERAKKLMRQRLYVWCAQPTKGADPDALRAIDPEKWPHQAIDRINTIGTSVEAIYFDLCIEDGYNSKQYPALGLRPLRTLVVHEDRIAPPTDESEKVAKRVEERMGGMGGMDPSQFVDAVRTVIREEATADRALGGKSKSK